MIIRVWFGESVRNNGSFTQEVIRLVFGVPLNPGNPVIRHTVHQLGPSALPEHGQILQHGAGLTGAQRPGWRQGEEPAHLSQVEVILKGEADVSVDVDLLLSVNIVWTHLPP